MRRFLPSYDHLEMTQYPAGWLAKYRDAWESLRQVSTVENA